MIRNMGGIFPPSDKSGCAALIWMEEPILAERWQEGENHMASVYDQHARTYGGPHVTDLVLPFCAWILECTTDTLELKQNAHWGWIDHVGIQRADVQDNPGQMGRLGLKNLEDHVSWCVCFFVGRLSHLHSPFFSYDFVAWMASLWSDTDLKLIFNALVSNPAWRTNVTNFSSPDLKCGHTLVTRLVKRITQFLSFQQVMEPNRWRWPKSRRRRGWSDPKGELHQDTKWRCHIWGLFCSWVPVQDLVAWVSGGIVTNSVREKPRIPLDLFSVHLHVCYIAARWFDSPRSGFERSHHL